MPWKECIPDIDDREFPSSVGHWQGDCTWDPGPIMEREGLAKLSFPDGTWERSMSLSDPFIKLVAGKNVSLWFLFHWPGGGVWGNLRASIADGNYEYFKYYPTLPYWTGWFWLGIPAFTVPGDWNIPNTVIVILCNAILHAADSMYFDKVSLRYWVEPRADHLPLMGVH